MNATIDNISSEIADITEITFPEVVIDDSEEEESPEVFALGTLPAPTLTPPPAAATNTTVDDFIRNFLARFSLTHTLEAFQAEWAELGLTASMPVPSAYEQTEELMTRLMTADSELERLQANSAAAEAEVAALRRERDYYCLHHRRTNQEKQNLLRDMRTLSRHIEKYEPALQLLESKLETAVRAQTLTAIERDRALARVQVLEAALGGAAPPPPPRRREQKQQQQQQRLPAIAKNPAANNTTTTNPNSTSTLSSTSSPLRPRLPPYSPPQLSATLPSPPTSALTLTRGPTFRPLPEVTSLAPHPTHSSFAVGGADAAGAGAWAVLSSAGATIVSGGGHSAWVSAVAFHPGGAGLATASADHTVRVWDFAARAATGTLVGHADVVWDVSWCPNGLFLASASQDRSLRIWDVVSGACVGAGHLGDAILSCRWGVGGGIVTGGADKSVCIWDPVHLTAPVITLRGHRNAVLWADWVPETENSFVVSQDADGFVRLWDVLRGECVAEAAGGSGKGGITGDGAVLGPGQVGLTVWAAAKLGVNGKELACGPASAVTSLHDMIITADDTGSVVIWNRS